MARDKIQEIPLKTRVYSAAILKENDIETIYLVTHAWHMPRAVMMFEKARYQCNPGTYDVHLK